jgi:hypothetical protein
VQVEHRVTSQSVAVVGGMIAAVPWQGGATWAVLQYLLGLRKLGWQVYFVESLDLTGPGASDAVRYCSAIMDRFELAGRWALVDSGTDHTAGMNRRELLDIARSADVLINLSGTLVDPELFELVDLRVFLDLDPAFIQLWQAVEGIDMGLDSHTHFVSLADTIGRTGSPIPTCGRTWIPTLPPVVLEEWPRATGKPDNGVTTVAHWRGYGSIEHEGIHFGQKAHSWRSLAEVPRKVSERFEPALEIDSGDGCDLDNLVDNGWKILDPSSVASDPDTYRRFVQGSRAELCVAKSGYVVSDSGWFSDRSACYLASGRPVIAQDTGFDRRLPTGDGLFAFDDADDVVRIVNELNGDYRHHRQAARRVAEEHLDSDHVLGQLLDRIDP